MLIRRDRAMLAVAIMLDVAFHGTATQGGRSETVNAGEIADRIGLARRGMEPMLQALSRAGLLDSVRGPRGGYRLGRPRRDIRLSEIVDVAGGADDPPADGPTGALQEVVVDRLWGELEAGVRERLAALSLEDLVRRAATAGLRRPVGEPLTFSI